MFSKINGICRMLWYKLKHGGKISFEGFPKFEIRARINLKKGIIRVGESFLMKPNSYIAVVNGGRMTIGDHVVLNRNAIIVCHDSVTIGDNCSVAPNVLIYDHDHRFGTAGKLPGFKTAPVIIEKNSWIGAGVVILRGTHIGEGCVIGAGCVVKGDIPAHSIVTSDRNLKIATIENRDQ